MPFRRGIVPTGRRDDAALEMAGSAIEPSLFPGASSPQPQADVAAYGADSSYCSRSQRLPYRSSKTATVP